MAITSAICSSFKQELLQGNTALNLQAGILLK